MTIKKLKINYIVGEKLELKISADKKTVNEIKEIYNKVMENHKNDADRR